MTLLLGACLIVWQHGFVVVCRFVVLLLYVILARAPRWKNLAPCWLALDTRAACGRVADQRAKNLQKSRPKTTGNRAGCRVGQWQKVYGGTGIAVRRLAVAVCWVCAVVAAF